MAAAIAAVLALSVMDDEGVRGSDANAPSPVAVRELEVSAWAGGEVDARVPTLVNRPQLVWDARDDNVAQVHLERTARGCDDSAVFDARLCRGLWRAAGVGNVRRASAVAERVRLCVVWRGSHTHVHADPMI